MSAAVLRCPNCGTVQERAGECEACHDADVRLYCPNHTPGRWLDGAACPGAARAPTSTRSPAARAPVRRGPARHVRAPPDPRPHRHAARPRWGRRRARRPRLGARAPSPPSNAARRRTARAAGRAPAGTRPASAVRPASATVRARRARSARGGPVSDPADLRRGGPFAHRRPVRRGAAPGGFPARGARAPAGPGSAIHRRVPACAAAALREVCWWLFSSSRRSPQLRLDHADS
jgi:hypothetical protein